MKKTILAAVLMTSLGLGGAAEEIMIIDGSTTVGLLAKTFSEYFMAENPGVKITVSESGSGNGAKSLVNAVCDIATMSHPMKDSEFQAAVEKNIQPVAHVVALDGLPILVHPENTVKGLTLDQIRKIYTGQITNWKEVGGPDMTIVVITRDTDSGTYESFENLVMSKQKISDKAEYVGSNGAIRQRVQSIPSAIGYAALGFVDKTVKVLPVNGVHPTAATVRTGEYPIARPLFLYTAGYPDLGSALYRFVTLHLSRDGQEMIERIGFIPVTAY